jgi:hypothetical protein
VIICPWCGTHYAEFQSSCNKCGGSLPLPPVQSEAVAEIKLAPPPPAPRSVPDSVARRILFIDAWGIVGLVFGLLGAIFLILGIALTLPLVTAVVGLPFDGFGALFLALGLPLLIFRYGKAKRTVELLRQGTPVQGQIVQVSQNHNVRVNHRHPWTIRYRFEAMGRGYEGQVTTLAQPDLSQQPGRPVYVLYQTADPEQNTIYPSPFGYYSLET